MRFKEVFHKADKSSNTTRVLKTRIRYDKIAKCYLTLELLMHNLLSKTFRKAHKYELNNLLNIRWHIILFECKKCTIYSKCF